MEVARELKYFLICLRIVQNRNTDILEISQEKYLTDVLAKFGVIECKH